MIKDNAPAWTDSVADLDTVVRMPDTTSPSIDRKSGGGSDGWGVSPVNGRNSQLCLGLRPNTLLPSGALATGQP